jgi:hypothetical protein
LQPTAGSVLSTTRPTFVVALDSGEFDPWVTVGNASGEVGSCVPYPSTPTPAQGSCQLPVDLGPGNYTWTFSYWANNDCSSVPGICLPQQWTYAPIGFTISLRPPEAAFSV